MRIGRYIPARPKTVLKSWRNQLKNAWIQRFHSFTPVRFLGALRRLGIQPGDVLIAHTSYGRFAGFDGGIGDAIRVLQEAVGEDGTLLMPTLPFSGSAIDYVSETPITDLRKTPSRMGLLTEIFRRLPGVTRSIHPTHPIAAWGRHSEIMLEGHATAGSPCGMGSPYHKLLEFDGKILLAGVTIRSMTFYHCVEEMLESLLPTSPFTRKIYSLQSCDRNGQLHLTQSRLYERSVSKRRDCGLMIDPLRERGCWHETKVGRLPLIALSAREVLSTAEDMARRGIFCYI